MILLLLKMLHFNQIRTWLIFIKKSVMNQANKQQLLFIQFLLHPKQDILILRQQGMKLTI